MPSHVKHLLAGVAILVALAAWASIDMPGESPTIKLGGVLCLAGRC